LTHLQPIALPSGDKNRVEIAQVVLEASANARVYLIICAHQIEHIFRLESRHIVDARRAGSYLFGVYLKVICQGLPSFIQIYQLHFFDLFICFQLNHLGGRTNINPPIFNQNIIT